MPGSPREAIYAFISHEVTAIRWFCHSCPMVSCPFNFEIYRYVVRLFPETYLTETASRPAIVRGTLPLLQKQVRLGAVPVQRIGSKEALHGV